MKRWFGNRFLVDPPFDTKMAPPWILKNSYWISKAPKWTPKWHPKMTPKCIPKWTPKWEPKFAHVCILIQNGVKMGTRNGTPKWDPTRLDDRIFYRKNWGLATKNPPEWIPKWVHKWPPQKGTFWNFKKIIWVLGSILGSILKAQNGSKMAPKMEPKMEPQIQFFLD